MTVAVPVLNGARTLEDVLAAVRAQQLDAEVEVVVCDSGSQDGSPAIAERYGAAVFRIDRRNFSHGGTRNQLAERATGSHIAFLTQDAVPASPTWLAELLLGFQLTSQVGLVFGPYRARADATPRVRRELESWFRSFAPDAKPRIDRLVEMERRLRPRDLIGPRSFFTDANGCIARHAWERVPFRPIPYAEDHQLALDMLSAGYAKVYMPSAEVIHSHDYGLATDAKRSFDEWRALREVYGYVEPLSVDALRRSVVGTTRADVRFMRDEGATGARLAAAAIQSGAHHVARFAGAVLGTRSDALNPELRRRLSFERRATFIPSIPPGTPGEE